MCPQRPRWVEARLAFRTLPQPEGSPGTTAPVAAAARGPSPALTGPARRALLDAVSRRCGVPPGCVLLERVGVDHVGTEAAAAVSAAAAAGNGITHGLGGEQQKGLGGAGILVGSQGEGCQLLCVWLTVKLPRGTAGVPGGDGGKTAGGGCGGCGRDGAAASAGDEQQCAANRIAESLVVGAEGGSVDVRADAVRMQLRSGSFRLCWTN